MKTLFTDAQRQALREARYEADLDNRAEAERAWNHLVRYIKAHASHLDEIQLGSGANARDGFYVKGPDAGLPRGLLVAFMRGKGSTAGSYGIHKGAGHIIAIYDALEVPGDADDLVLRLGRLPRLKYTFVHEFTHYMDQMRRKGRGHMGLRSRDARKRGDWDNYYQSPEEFNAYFQEITTVIEARFDQLLDNASLGRALKVQIRKNMERIFANFESFWHFVSEEEGTTRHRMKQALDPMKGSKWERKWMKRMVVFYAGLKRRVMDALR